MRRATRANKGTRPGGLGRRLPTAPSTRLERLSCRRRAAPARLRRCSLSAGAARTTVKKIQTNNVAARRRARRVGFLVRRVFADPRRPLVLPRAPPRLPEDRERGSRVRRPCMDLSRDRDLDRATGGRVGRGRLWCSSRRRRVLHVQRHRGCHTRGLAPPDADTGWGVAVCAATSTIRYAIQSRTSPAALVVLGLALDALALIALLYARGAAFFHALLVSTAGDGAITSTSTS